MTHVPHLILSSFDVAVVADWKPAVFLGTLTSACSIKLKVFKTELVNFGTMHVGGGPLEGTMSCDNLAQNTQRV